MLRETKLRSVLKTLSWRLLATVTTMSLVLVMTGTWAVALSVGGMEILGKLLLYYFHERAWQRLSWGVISSSDHPLSPENQPHPTVVASTH